MSKNVDILTKRIFNIEIVNRKPGDKRSGEEIMKYAKQQAFEAIFGKPKQPIKNTTGKTVSGEKRRDK